MAETIEARLAVILPHPAFSDATERKIPTNDVDDSVVDANASAAGA